LLFILSEIMFFGALFGSYIYIMLHPNIWIGSEWPPTRVFLINPWMLPLANALLLIASGICGEIAHTTIALGSGQKTSHFIFLLLFLGGTFLGIQIFEYCSANFGFDDSIYGSLFFFITGFHGIHVMVGLILIYVQLFRIIRGVITRQHHIGFDLALWYWHFVDIIWLVVWTLLYLYPSL